VLSSLTLAKVRSSRGSPLPSTGPLPVGTRVLLLSDVSQ